MSTYHVSMHENLPKLAERIFPKQSGQIWGLFGEEWGSNGPKLVRYEEVVAKKVKWAHLMERNRVHE
jgi:hypothetical protein